MTSSISSLTGHFAQPDLLGLVDRNQDAQAAVQPPQNVKALDLAGDLFLLDPHHLGHALGRINRFVTNREFAHHDVDFLLISDIGRSRSKAPFFVPGPDRVV